ncbi:MAG TPA: hypothetical protein VEK07_07960 [Polyangiaceae bacterium]|nr:hypothetical protein [Polyangiaceae bacterium]
MPSIARDRFARWIGARSDGRPLAAFRRAFAAIWLAYDAVDVVWGMTERSRGWFPHPRDGRLVLLQLALVASGTMLVLGKRIWTFGLTAAVARGLEALFFFPLNDFYYGSVMYLLVAHSDGGPCAAHGRLQEPPDERRAPKWVHDVLLLEMAWIYLATATLKLSPDWLGGGHLFVRTQYLALGLGWPYPAFVAHALGNLAVDAALAKVAVGLELALATVLVARGPYWLGVTLAVTIHAVGALLTNVWFFSASMIAGVVFLLPRPPSRARPKPAA